MIVSDIFLMEILVIFTISFYKITSNSFLVLIFISLWKYLIIKFFRRIMIVMFEFSRYEKSREFD